MTGEEMDASISQSDKDHSTGKHILGDIIGTSEEQGSGVVEGIGEDKRKLGEELIASTTHRCRIPLQHGSGVRALPSPSKFGGEGGTMCTNISASVVLSQGFIRLGL